MQRRDFLAAIAVVASLGGCQLLPWHESDVEALHAELDQLLRDLPPEQRAELQRLAARLRHGTSQMLEVHAAFLDRFNAAAANRDVGSEALQAIYVKYEQQRQVLRRDLLQVQDEMHAVTPPEFWPEVRDILHRKGPKLAAGRAG